MINYTTPTITLTVESVDVSTGYDVYVSLEQNGTKLTKTGEDLTISTETQEGVTNTIIVLGLTQEESASFRYNSGVSIQVNWIKDGVRGATEIKSVRVMRNLLDEVISDEG